MEPQVADCDDLEVGTLVRFVGTQLAPESDIGIVIKLPADPGEYIGIKWIRDGLCQHNTTGMDDAFYHGHLEIVK